MKKIKISKENAIFLENELKEKEERRQKTIERFKKGEFKIKPKV
jgi:hypothetical protein|tara:strand:- start:22 stop:153 length:132 start_codon:yes stop_codon:yes gene_type:complete